MPIQLDFSNVPTNEPVPAGRYPVVVEQVECRDSKSSDSKYLNWELRILDGEFANRRLFMMTSLSAKALWRLRSVLINLDAYEEQLDIEVDEGSDIVISPELVGLTGTAVVKIETYQGEERAKVDELLDDDGVDRERAARKTKGGPKGGGRAPGQQKKFLSREDVPTEARDAEEGAEGELVGAATGATKPLDRAALKLR
jgi:hypothetical protein